MSSEPLPLAGEDLTSLRDAYVAAVLVPDARRARELVLGADAPAERLYLEVLHPALVEIGDRWEQARISVAREHLATQVTQAVLAQLAARLSPGDGGRGRTAIICCPPGELHSLGGQMVADFLEADGWRVLTLGADVPAHELAQLAEAEAAHLVALSTVLPEHLLAAGAACAALRRLDEPPLIVAGGRAFAGDEARAKAVGADALAADPQSLLALLAERLP